MLLLYSIVVVVVVVSHIRNWNMATGVQCWTAQVS